MDVLRHIQRAAPPAASGNNPSTDPSNSGPVRGGALQSLGVHRMWWPRERGGMDLRYRSLFDNRGILRLVRTGLPARLPIAAYGIGLLVRFRERCGSYVVAGAMAAAYTGGLCAVPPMLGGGRILAMISGPTMKEASSSALPSQSAPGGRCSDHRSGAGVGHRPRSAGCLWHVARPGGEPRHRRWRSGSPRPPGPSSPNGGRRPSPGAGLPSTTGLALGSAGAGVAAEHLGAAGALLVAVAGRARRCRRGARARLLADRTRPETPRMALESPLLERERETEALETVILDVIHSAIGSGGRDRGRIRHRQDPPPAQPALDGGRTRDGRAVGARLPARTVLRLRRGPSAARTSRPRRGSRRTPRRRPVPGKCSTPSPSLVPTTAASSPGCTACTG